MRMLFKQISKIKFVCVIYYTTKLIEISRVAYNALQNKHCRE